MRIPDKAIIDEASRHPVFTARSLCDAMGIPGMVRSISRRLRDLADAGAIGTIRKPSPAVYCPAESRITLTRRASAEDIREIIGELRTFTLDDLVLECTRRGLSNADYPSLAGMIRSGRVVRDRHDGERWVYRRVEPCA